MESEAVLRSRQLIAERNERLGASLVFVAEVGSKAQGLSTGASDLDATAIWVETFAEMVRDNFKASRMIRTAAEGERSAVGDVDVNVYTARKATLLLLKGNPSIQEAFASPYWWRIDYGVDVGEWVSRLPALAFSKHSLNAYLGYMTQQFDRWRGERGKNVTRPELVEQYGYDVKYASHIIRLGYQACEYVRCHGMLQLPMEQTIRDAIMSVKTGAVREHEAVTMVKTLMAMVKTLLGSDDIPDQPKVEEVWQETENLYRQVYGWY